MGSFQTTSDKCCSLDVIVYKVLQPSHLKSRGEWMQQGRHEAESSAASWRRFVSANGTWIALLVLLTLVAIWFLGFTFSKYGIGTSPDSVRYIESSSIVKTNGLRSLIRDDLPLNRYLGSRTVASRGGIFFSGPPAYPVALAVVSAATGLSEKRSAAVLNLILFAALPSALFMVCRFALGAGKHVSAAAAVAAFMWPTLHVAKMAWTELGFAVLVLLFFGFAGAVIRRPRPLVCAALGAVVAAAFYWKFVGLYLLPLGIVACFISRAATKNRLSGAFIFFIASSIPIGAWIVRNTLIIGCALGPRSASDRTFVENCDHALSTIGSYFVFWKSDGTVDFWVGIVGTVVLVLIAAGVGSRRVRHDSFPDGDKLMVLVSGYCVLFLGLMIVSGTLYRIDPLNARLLYPVQLPMMLVFLVAAGKILSARSQIGGPHWMRLGIQALVLCAALVFLVGHAQFVYSFALTSHRKGAGGYSNDRWMTSDVIVWLRENRGLLHGLDVYSNAPDALSIILGMDAKFSPLASGSGELVTSHPIFSREKSILVWFKHGRTYVLPPEEIQMDKQSLYSGAHGVVYEMMPHSTANLTIP